MKTKMTGLTDPKAGGMSAKLESSLSQIASLSKPLNEASDQLSKQLADIESALNSYELGIRAWLKDPLVSEEVESENAGWPILHDVYRLGYDKYNRKWGLLVCSGIEEFGEEYIGFLRDAPREIRLKAVDKIPELVNLLVQQLAKTTEEASKKAAQAEEIVAALSKKQR